MIQFNLLPDVKIEFLKTRYRRRLVTAISAVSTAVCIVIFTALFIGVRVGQTKHLSDLNDDIKARSATLQGKKDLNKILTIQNQLNSLPGLHDKRVIASRLFDYLSRVVPPQATITNLNVDFLANKMTITGTTDTIATVNKFVDTLKFTDYQVQQTVEQSKNNEPGNTGKAFNSVVLSNFSLTDTSAASQQAGVSYQIDLLFEAAIFATIKDLKDPAKPAVELKIPSIISTRSETEKPLFTAPAVPDTNKNPGLGR